MSELPADMGHAPSGRHNSSALAPPDDRARWVRQARLLAWLGVGWHGIEAAVAVGAGLVAGSVALVGFGADSVVEALAGFIVIWRFAGARQFSETAERRAQRLIAASFFMIAAYVGIEAVRNLIGGEIPDASWVGLGLALVTTLTMPLLAWAKGRVSARLGSSATRSEGRQNLLCAYLSVALLVGLGANAFLGWWWADPLAALIIVGVAVKEGWETWRGDPCCDDEALLLAQTASRNGNDQCDDACCHEAQSL